MFTPGSASPATEDTFPLTEPVCASILSNGQRPTSMAVMPFNNIFFMNLGCFGLVVGEK
jgi:hypothetical protein